MNRKRLNKIDISLTWFGRRCGMKLSEHAQLTGPLREADLVDILGQVSQMNPRFCKPLSSMNGIPQRCACSD